MGRLEGKVTVVTGAGSGIGYACAHRFAEEGAAVVGCDLTESTDWDRVASAAKGSQFHIVDVRDEAAQAEVAVKTLEEFEPRSAQALAIGGQQKPHRRPGNVAMATAIENVDQDRDQYQTQNRPRENGIHERHHNPGRKRFRRAAMTPLIECRRFSLQDTYSKRHPTGHACCIAHGRDAVRGRSFGGSR